MDRAQSAPNHAGAMLKVAEHAGLPVTRVENGVQVAEQEGN